MSDRSQSLCRECGEELPKETLFERYQKRHRHCRSCGTVVTENTKYCPDCGRRMED